MGVGSVLNLQDHYEVNITKASLFHKVLVQIPYLCLVLFFSFLMFAKFFSQMDKRPLSILYLWRFYVLVSRLRMAIL
jgi:hypothetical protein